mmetsp:Transcript_8327/g.13932  ORF Transcript_8327/g.13932 Transcript_8327/m.13932 type:complete len:93 (-) Transcript_8327:323-601(-)
MMYREQERLQQIASQRSNQASSRQPARPTNDKERPTASFGQNAVFEYQQDSSMGVASNGIKQKQSSGNVKVGQAQPINGGSGMGGMMNNRSQ